MSGPRAARRLGAAVRWAARRWTGLPLRWQLVLINGVVAVTSGIAILELIHRLPKPWFSAVMHDAASSTPAAGQAMFEAAVDRQVIPAIAIAVVLALGLNLLTVTLALRPLSGVRRAARRLATGDTSVRVHSHRRDEIGDVARAFDEMASSLDRLEQLRLQAANDVAHELRTPIHNALGLVEAMRDGVVDAGPALLARTHGEITRLAALVGDLQRLSEAHAAGANLHRETLSLTALAQDVLEGFAAVFAERRLTYRIDAPDGSANVDADPGRLRQVVSNIVANAARYAEEGSVIDVRISRGSGRVRVELTDRGPEIPAAALPYIFERFFRVDPSRNRDSGGTGVGLAIVRDLVEAHGGLVGAASAEGTATVWFELPLRAGEPRRGAASPSPVTSPSLTRA